MIWTCQRCGTKNEASIIKEDRCSYCGRLRFRDLPDDDPDKHGYD